MPRFVRATEVSCIYDKPIVLVDLVVSLLQPEVAEIGERVGEYLFRELEYCKAVVGSKIR